MTPPLDAKTNHSSLLKSPHRVPRPVLETLWGRDHQWLNSKMRKLRLKALRKLLQGAEVGFELGQ